MIPIKWDKTSAKWIITTKDDSDWYSYKDGIYANVMLSDGYYKSEISAGIDIEKQLASNNVGVGLVRPEDIGTIFTWVPRLMYNDANVEYLVNTSIVEYKWTTPKCFTYFAKGADKINLELTGMWVGKETSTDVTTIENKSNDMNTEENRYGLIKNEIVSTITNEERLVVQKLYQKTGNVNNATTIGNIENEEYRQIIKVVKTNERELITPSHAISDNTIQLKTKYSANGIKYILDGSGNIISTDDNCMYNMVDEDNYTFYFVDNVGNIKKHIVSLIGKPNIKYFNKNTTFYVSYDEEGNETSNIPIGESAPANWYDYDNQIWPNIVCRNDGDEAYYVWIPRYMYTLDTANQEVDAILVGTDNCYYDEFGNIVSLDETEYILPEAFIWNGEQISGYWMTKYKLSTENSYIPNIDGTVLYGSNGVITIKDVVSTIGTSYKYEAYLIQNGKRIQGPIEITGDYTFENLPIGEYSVNIIVKDSSGKHIRGITKQVTVEKVVEPVLTGFRVDTTYIITEFNDDGTAKTKQALKDVLKEGYTVDSNNALITGEIDYNKVNGIWFNYDIQFWANIVTINNGKIMYAVWIPRYEYKLDTTNQQTNVKFIPVTQTSADKGYAIPEAFAWNGTAIPGYWMTKYKLSS